MHQQLIHHLNQNGLSYLIRHADRELIPIGEIGNEIPINEKGRKRAIEFGQSLKSSMITRILTSPILRCVQTANSILEGYGEKREVVQTKALGDPGLHISDPKIAGEFYLQYGFDEMYKRFTSGGSIPGVPSPLQLKDSLTNFIRTNASLNGITLFISHDSLIAFYKFALDGTILSRENWVDYLSGILINHEQDEN